MNAPDKSHHHNESKRPGAIDQFIGSRLRLWRRTMKVDAYALATTIGITYQQLQKYEKGLNRISAARLYAISRALNIPVDYFYQEVEAQSQTPDGEAYRILLEDGGADLLRCYGIIKDPGVRTAVLNLLRSIAAEQGNKANDGGPAGESPSDAGPAKSA